ncbi:hypothetical protein ACG3SL_03110 [Sphingomonas sp. CJ20]
MKLRRSPRDPESRQQFGTPARFKANTAQIDPGPVDLIDLLTAIVDDANIEERAKSCAIRHLSSAAFVTTGNGELLYRAFRRVEG